MTQINTWDIGFSFFLSSLCARQVYVQAHGGQKTTSSVSSGMLSTSLDTVSPIVPELTN